MGLLHKHESDRVSEAINMYRDRKRGPDSAEAVDFRSRYSREMPIKFLGVWDTVAALGLLIRPFTGWWTRKHGFHDAKLSEIVDYAYQGLAIDEKRRVFKASVWSRDPYKQGEGKRGNGRGTDQTVEQVWFSGAHSDIGGSYPKHGLSDIALRWMLDKATKLGLEVGLHDTNGYIAEFANDTVPVVINDSRPAITKAFYAYHREYGVTNSGTESVHHTVIDNHKDHRPGPPPKNLSKYFDSGTLRITDQDGNIALSQ